MKIIYQGTKPDTTKRFNCEYCGTVFEAEQGEYHLCNQMEYVHDGLEYKCFCPVCNETVYIKAGG